LEAYSLRPYLIRKREVRVWTFKEKLDREKDVERLKMFANILQSSKEKQELNLNFQG